MGEEIVVNKNKNGLQIFNSLILVLILCVLVAIFVEIVHLTKLFDDFIYTAESFFSYIKQTSR